MLTVIGSYNLHFKLKPSQVRKDLAKLLSSNDIDVLGMQEMGKPVRVLVLNKIGREYGWEFFRPNDLPAQRQTPIGWNNERWEALQTGAQRLNDSTEVEPGSGGTTVESKWAPWVILRNRKNDRTIAVINWHAPGGVENPKNVKRRAVMEECTASVKELARELEKEVQSVFITGDMNINFRKPELRALNKFPIKAFKNAGFYACWEYNMPKIGTHTHNGMLKFLPTGRRIIDYVFSNDKPISSEILLGYSSDHRPVLVTYR